MTAALALASLLTLTITMLVAREAHELRRAVVVHASRIADAESSLLRHAGRLDALVELDRVAAIDHESTVRRVESLAARLDALSTRFGQLDEVTADRFAAIGRAIAPSAAPESP